MRYSSLAVLVACSLAANLAQAADYSPGKITFVGEVSEQTCHATVNGQSEALILLPTVPVAELKDKNSKVGLTTFTLNVTGCTQNSADTSIKVNFHGRNVTDAGNLGNIATDSPAKNVAVQLTAESDGTNPINLKNKDSVIPVDGLVLLKDADNASYDFAAQYFTEEGAATAGRIQAIVEYSLSYQ